MDTLIGPTQDLHKLKQLLDEKDARLKQQDDEIQRLQQLLHLMRAQKFGRKSEQLNSGLLDQLHLFDTAASEKPKQVEKQQVVKEHTRKTRSPRQLPPDLPRREEIIDIPEQEKLCGCGRMRKCIGHEVSERVEHIPAKAEVVVLKRPKYACPCEGVDAEGEPVVKVAPLPPSILPKTWATPSLLVFIVLQKFLYGMPLYRIERQFAAMNLPIDRKLMSAWLLRLADQLTPLQKLMIDQIKAAPWIGIDETRIKVNEKKGKQKHKNGHMWVAYGPKPKCIVYSYFADRKDTFPRKFFDGWSGVVIADGWSAYNFLDPQKERKEGDPPPPIQRAGCWAHARRKFHDVVKLIPEKSRKGETFSEQMLVLIGKMYKKHKDIDPDADAAARLAYRQTEIKPILDEIHEMARTVMETSTPTGYLKKAITYLLNNWSRLSVFGDHPDVPLDNNLTENAIRPFVIGRKNWLFAGSPAGAHAAALFYSLVETAKAQDLDLEIYFTHLFQTLPSASKEADYKALLPFKQPSR